ncbi:hypothetical protein [Rhodoferax aquaticus]|uniref:Uncharacterized protein n=1 Tax=Rhodoferax aquaticus TaxID=2527691 RepID=A0A515EK85_9BURK|nr:hypothetical protein [Rhodoferax aquaticus]QDL53066.1 hypothetical protein EXZ61_02160 [Rhodoferax aquaticus]
MPLKNLLVEVRQVQSSQGQGTDVRGGLAVGVGSNGSVDMQGRIGAQSSQSQQSARVLQQALVLNGRSANINLGRSLPLRLLQTVKLQGVWRTVESAVFLDANTGFAASPRWDGGDGVELVLSAQQTATQVSGSQVVNGTSSASSTVLLPLGEWFTVAHSEQQINANTQGLTGLSNQAGAVDTDLQVRITVR